MEGVLPGPVGDFASRTGAPAAAKRLARLGYHVLIKEAKNRPWPVLLHNCVVSLWRKQRKAAIQLEARVQARTRELQAANAELQEATRQAEQACRHKSEFLANLYHELRIPLNSIIGFAKLLQDQTFGPLTAKQAGYVDHIHRSGQHLISLIIDLLDLSKVEAGKLELRPEAFHLREALAAALTEIRPQAEAKRLQLELQADRAVVSLTADPVRFRQILSNLLSNAVKFTPDGGGISIRAREVHTSQVTVEGAEKPDPERPPDFIELTVQDTGIGIAAEELPKLFQPFTQLESPFAKRYEGTGLGLALTKRLVELHGGQIFAVSEGAGRGTTFTVCLPLGPQARRDRGDDAQVDPRGREEPAPPGVSLGRPRDMYQGPRDWRPGSRPSSRPKNLRMAARVLVVDDDPATVELLQEFLVAKGYEVLTAADGAEALQKVREERPHLILLDILMPKLGGLEVLRQLRQIDPMVGVIMVTAVNEEETARQAMALGAFDYITKPLDLSYLEQSLWYKITMMTL